VLDQLLEDIEVGAAQGLHSIALLRQGFDSVGIEPWAEAIETGKQIGRDIGTPVEIVQGVGEELPFEDASFDVVLAENVMEHVTDPDAVFAEVAHLPEGRIGNVLCRPVLRDYEIAYLGGSGAPPDRQLPAADLRVSVRDDRIVLRSVRLDREVIPRMTTAHNYTWRSLPVYRFLCLLQHQGVAAGLQWDWGPLAEAPFLPRVRCGRVVLR
jgi:SAM-dependent methyltransferase